MLSLYQKNPKKSTVLIRCDSGSQVGLGHVMRDIVYVKQYHQSSEVYFACRDLKGNINHKIPYSVHTLKSNKPEELQNLINSLHVDTLVIDNYEVNYEFETELKTKNPKLKIIIFDDEYKEHFCDEIINHNLSADRQKYKNPSLVNIIPPLIREEFKKEKQIKREKIYDYLVAMGGADTTSINIPILKTLPQNSKIALLTTSANANLKELKEFVQNKKNISLHVNSNEVAKLINQSKFAIITPSVIVYEALFMGVDFMAVKTAENQRDMYEYLQKNNYLCLEKYEEKKCKKILELFHIEFLNFTTLSLNEKKMVLSWRNHSKIQNWMFQQDDIELSAHLQYIDSLKTSKEKLYFMIKKESIYIGVIDFTAINFKTQSAKIGIYANPKLTRIGNILMDSILYYGFYILKLKKLSSEVFQDNITAIKLYRRYNFKETSKYFSNQKNILAMELNYENSQF